MQVHKEEWVLNNKKRLKWLISSGLLVISLLVALPIIGSESDHKNVTLQSIKTRVLGNNLEIVRVNENVMIAEYKLDEAEDNKLKGGSSSIESSKNNQYYPIEAQMNLDYAEWQQTATKERVVLEAYKQYYSYFLLLDKIELQQGKMARLEEDLKQVETKISLGTATLTAKNSAELAIKQASFDLQKLIDQRDAAFLDLNVLMKYDLDTPLVLEAEPVPYEVYSTESVTKDVEKVLEENGDLAKLESQLELASIDLNIYINHNGSGQYDKTITSKKEAISDLNLDVKEKKLNLEYEVRSMYNGLLSAKDTVEIKSLELENMEMALDVAQKRYDVGFETITSLNIAKENVETAIVALEEAKLAYYIEVETYKNFVN